MHLNIKLHVLTMLWASSNMTTVLVILIPCTNLVYTEIDITLNELIYYWLPWDPVCNCMA